MDNRTIARRPNGKRLEGKGLAIKMTQDIKGMALAQAFIVLKSAGFLLRVSRLDGINRTGFGTNDERVSICVEADVVDGVVKSAWVK